MKKKKIDFFGEITIVLHRVEAISNNSIVCAICLSMTEHMRSKYKKYADISDKNPFRDFYELRESRDEIMNVWILYTTVFVLLYLTR